MKYKYDREKIKQLSDGRYASEIAEIVKCPQSYIYKVWKKFPDLPRPKACSPKGSKNSSWKGGRMIQRCGRVLVPSPENHPNARVYGNKKIGRILEHRLVMEKHLGRYLTKEEVVDHLDECVIHNDLSNLRLYSSNAEHLKSTITGRPKDLSSQGRKVVRSTHSQRKGMKQVNNHEEMWRCGDYRLLQIFHAWLLLDKDSPYLLGTHRYMIDRQIDPYDENMIKDNLRSLCHKMGTFPKIVSTRASFLRHPTDPLKHYFVCT